MCLEYEVNSKVAHEGTRESIDSRNVYQSRGLTLSIWREQDGHKLNIISELNVI